MHVQIPNEAAWRGAPRYILTGVWKPEFPSIESGAPTHGISTLRIKSCGCGCDGGCHHLGWLGDAGTLTADQALAAAVAMYSGDNLNPKSMTSAWYSFGARQISAGAFDPYPGCSGQAKPMSLLTTAGGIGLSVGGATTGIMVATHVISAATGAILGAATLGIGALVSVVGMIFAHHAAAVARDMSFLCSAVPGATNAFQVINQAVKSGQTTPAAAIAALDEVYSQFMTAGGASGSTSGPGNIPDSGVAINKHPYCNAGCEMSIILKGMVLYWQSQYQAMAAKQAAAAPAAAPASTPTPAGTLVSTATPAGAAAAAPAGGIPSFALIAAAVIGAVLFLK